jgi:prepilin-type N-terminal cleavage/methylation domain-containing protein
VFRGRNPTLLTQPWHTKRGQRGGFTLVELLVAMALTLFIMVILSEAFSAGLGAFRQLKATCDLQEKLRTAATIMRRDLQNFYIDNGTGTSLSQLDLGDPAYVPPDNTGTHGGFFRLWQQSTNAAGTPCCLSEGVDGDSLDSWRMVNPTDTLLHFTIRLQGSRPENFMSVPAMPANPSLTATGPLDLQASGIFNSQDAEVVYFLGPNAVGTSGTTKIGATPFGGLPLYALYRRQILAPSKTDAATLNTTARVAYTNSPSYPPEAANYYEISCKQDNTTGGVNTDLYFTSTSELSIPELRFGMNTGFGGPLAAGTPLKSTATYYTYPTVSDQIYTGTPPLPAQTGDDILLTNVVSFTVQVLLGKSPNSTYNPPTFPLRNPPARYMDLFDSTIPPCQNSIFNGYTGLKVKVFDTWSQANIPPYNYTTYNTGPPPTVTFLPLAIRVVGLQIILRIWDEKTERTRQITIMQDM